MKECFLDVPKNTKNYSIMSGVRSRHELTNQINNIGKVRTGESKIDETSHQLSV
jgi:hypothetical protein